MSSACTFERAVVRAAESDHWTDELREHAARCSDCAEAVTVAPWIARFSQMQDREHILPDPSLVWLKAQLIRTTADAERATRPLNVMQAAAYLMVAGAWAWVLTWKWSAIEGWMHQMTPAGLMESAAQVQTLSLPLIAVLLVLASITGMLALHTIVAEE